MSEKRSGRNWNKYAFEMLSIIVGVLIALAVDEWNEDRENALRAESALKNIHKEMTTNLKILNAIHAQNMAARETLQNESRNPDSDSTEITPGIMLLDVAWETLLNNSIAAHIEYDELLKISELYALQAIYKRFGEQFIQQLYETRNLSVVMGKTMTQDEIIKTNPDALNLMLTIEGQLQQELTTYLDEIQ